MIDSKAYTEVFYILNQMSDNMREKIPTHIMENIKNRMDCNYNFKINENIKNTELLPDTEKMLSVLYIDYFANTSEKSTIKELEKNIYIQNELEKKKKYNYNDIFSENIDRKLSSNSYNILNKNTDLIVKVPKENFFKRIYSKIKNIFS
jgi:hypothetical protein